MPCAAWRIACLTVLAGACSTRAPDERAGERPAAAPAEERAPATASAPTEAAGPSAADEPPAYPATAVGTVEPAPWLAGAERVVAVRDGGALYIVAGGMHWLKVLTPQGEEVAAVEARGSAHAMEVADLDGDGSAYVIVGRGRGRGALDVPATVSIHRFADLRRGTAKVEVVPLPDTERPDVRAVIPDSQRPGRLLVAFFDSKYFVQILSLERTAAGRWETTPVTRIRMAMAVTAGDVDGDGVTSIVVARPYGDSMSADGDVLVLDGERRRVLPTLRGARAVVVVPRADGPGEIIYTDGWHREYARRARALVTAARVAGDGFEGRLLTHVEGRFGYDVLRVGDLSGDGMPDVVAAGNGPAVWLQPGAEGPGPVRALGDVDARYAYPVDIDGDGADEVLLLGDRPGIWRHR